MATRDNPLDIFSYKPHAYEINPMDLIHWPANFYSFPEFIWRKECHSKEQHSWSFCRPLISLKKFFFKHLYWSIIALQCCVSFCFITKWISSTHTYIPISLPACISLPPSLPIPPLQVVTKHRADLPVLCNCFPLAIYFTFGSVYISPCHSLTSSQLTLPPPRVLKSILYVCVFIPVLPLGSS